MTKRLRRLLLVWLTLVVSTVCTVSVVTLVAQAPINLQDTLPFDTAVKTATLPNGLRYYIRQNARPAQRVSMRLAVKAGSMMEADDQQGLAHLIEHMAFNGSTHFKPGEVFAYFESVGARLGPHVNAYTSFDETVYMLDLPSDKPEILDKGMLALSDYAGGLTLSPDEINKERPVVIEEWRLGLGAGSRVRDKQFPLLFYKSRYAERLPIGKPDVIRNAPPERLRAFYDTWYRPERMAVMVVGDIKPDAIESAIKANFGPLKDRAPEAPLPDRTVPIHKELLVSVVSDPELTRTNVTIERKRPREREDRGVDYRRQIVQRLLEHAFDERFSDLERKPDAKFLGAGVGGGTLSREVATFTMGASIPDGKLEDGISVLAQEANRVKEFGFGAAEIERAKAWMSAYYEQAYAERDKTESQSYADEYVRHFLNAEPSPGIAFEYRLVEQVLPTITDAEVSAMAKALLSDDSRVILATSPQKAGIRIPTEAELQAALTTANGVRVTPWTETAASGSLMENPPTPGTVAERKTMDEVGVTVVRFSNGVTAWLKPTDFKNDQVLFSLTAPGGASTAPPSEYLEASMADDLASMSGLGNLTAADLQKMLSGKLAGARPTIGLSSHGISGGAAPTQLETALQLLYEQFTSPGHDPDAFPLMKRQLDAAVANRGRAPGQIFGEKLAQVNSVNHYVTQPLTTERVASLDKAKMQAFYRQAFSNAADFTFFMVGTFKTDDAVPLLARYIGSLPSTGHQTSAFRDVGLKFPSSNEQAKVEAGREPRGQTVISFFADPSPDPVEQEQLLEATTVLQIALRDILREELGQTYNVSASLQQPLPQRGGGHVEVRFGAAPENLDSMTKRVLQEIAHLQSDGPSADLTNRAKESARRQYETALKQNEYWLARLEAIHMFGRDPHEILTRTQRIDAITPQVLQATFKKYFPSDRQTIVTLVPAPTGP
ncbi:MAG TPA: insulinase family protein [Vicinamibacterales bacterium]|jgi:zinc protease